MVAVDTNKVVSIFVGEMGVKSAAVGGEEIYQRPGGYFYLELDTSVNEER